MSTTTQRGGLQLDANYISAVLAAQREIRYMLLCAGTEACLARDLLRLAFHDAGTFCKTTRTGGPNASILMGRELVHKGNEGLVDIVKLLDPIKQELPQLSSADLIQIAGVTAVETFGGPCIHLRVGRRDSKACPPYGRLPSSAKGLEQMKECFDRMGLSVHELVPLCGGLAFTAWDEVPTSDDVPATTPDRSTMQPKFDNSWFKDVTARFQASDSGSQDTNVHNAVLGAEMMADAECATLVRHYASDNDSFMHAYAHAHMALSELGCLPLTPIHPHLPLDSSLVSKPSTRDTSSLQLGPLSTADPLCLAAMGVATAGVVFLAWRRRQQVWRLALMDSARINPS